MLFSLINCKRARCHPFCVILFDRFIEKYGTHIIVGLSIGGQDVVLVKQDNSSNLGPSELKKHLDDLGDQLFTGTCNFTPNIKEQKNKVLVSH